MTLASSDGTVGHAFLEGGFDYLTSTEGMPNPVPDVVSDDDRAVT